MAKKRTLDWGAIWQEQSDWFTDEAKRGRCRCRKCGNHHNNDPEWEDQQAAIERIVEKHLRRTNA